jgi:hypothetical protein
MKKINKKEQSCSRDCQHWKDIDAGKPISIDVNGETLHITTTETYCILGHTKPKGENCKDFKHYLKEQKKIQLNINIKRYLKDT